MSQNIKHGLFFVLGVIALLTTWPHAFDWVANGGNILNPVQFYADAINAGGTAAFLSIDMAIAWLVFMIWVVYDADRIGMGMGMKWGWFFVALSYIGVSFTFPVYLIVRERWLDRRATADRGAPVAG